MTYTSRPYYTGRYIRLKLTGQAEDIKQASMKIKELYPYHSESSIKKSNPTGHHCFLTIFLDPQPEER